MSIVTVWNHRPMASKTQGDDPATHRAPARDGERLSRRGFLLGGIVAAMGGDVLLLAEAVRVPRRKPPSPGLARVPQLPPGPEKLQIAVSSDLTDYFADQRVGDKLKSYGLSVQSTGFGSGQLVDLVAAKTEEYAAVIPSSSAVAGEIAATLAAPVPQHPIFSTAVVVFTWEDLVPKLRDLGIVTGKNIFDIPTYLRLAQAGKEWSVLGTSTPVTVLMADPRKSNVGALFLAMASFALYGKGTAISTAAQAREYSGQIAATLSGLGQLPPSTDQVLDEFTSSGDDGVPMILGYESEFIEGSSPGAAYPMPTGATILYPKPRVDCQSIIIPLNSAGSRFLNAMRDPYFKEVAEDTYGFRVPGEHYLSVLQSLGVTVPDVGPVIPIPPTPILEDLIDDVEKKLLRRPAVRRRRTWPEAWPVGRAHAAGGASPRFVGGVHAIAVTCLVIV